MSTKITYNQELTEFGYMTKSRTVTTESCANCNKVQDQLTAANKRLKVCEDALRYISEDKDDESISGMWAMQYAAQALAKSEELKNGPA